MVSSIVGSFSVLLFVCLVRGMAKHAFRIVLAYFSFGGKEYQLSVKGLSECKQVFDYQLQIIVFGILQ